MSRDCPKCSSATFNKDGFTSRPTRHSPSLVDFITDAAREAGSLVLHTEWNRLHNLDLDRIKRLMRRPLFMDLRDVYEPGRVKAMGIEYYGVGRS